MAGRPALRLKLKICHLVLDDQDDGPLTVWPSCQGEMCKHAFANPVDEFRSLLGLDVESNSYSTEAYCPSIQQYLDLRISQEIILSGRSALTPPGL
jgi:hypothetical protein